MERSKLLLSCSARAMAASWNSVGTGEYGCQERNQNGKLGETSFIVYLDSILNWCRLRTLIKLHRYILKRILVSHKEKGRISYICQLFYTKCRKCTKNTGYIDI